MQTSPYRVFRIPILRFLRCDIPNRVHGGCSRDVNTSNSVCTQNTTASSDKHGNIWCDSLLSGQWLKKARDINSSYDKTSIWKEKTGFFNHGVDSPCLATSHTNNRARVNLARDENSKSNDNKVIWVGSDTEGRPLFQCTTAQYCHKNTRQRRCHEPCGCWEWHANLRKN